MLGLFDDYMSLVQNRLTSVTKIGGTPTYFPHLLGPGDAAETTFKSNKQDRTASADETGLLSAAQQSQLRSWQRCGVCGADMYLLAQAYAPAPTFALASSSSPHHRMLYVWCCNSAVCSQQPLDSWKSAVIQVDQEDMEAFGDEDAGLGAEENDEEEEDEEPYREHPLPASALPSTHAFPPCHVHVVPEPPFRPGAPFPARPPPPSVSPDGTTGLSEKEELKDLEKKVDLKNTAVDYHFEAFRARVAREPTQVIRYYPAPAPVSQEPSPSEESKNKKDEDEERDLLNGTHPLFMNPERVVRYFEKPDTAANAKTVGKRRPMGVVTHTDPSSAKQTAMPTTTDASPKEDEEEEEEDELELADEVEKQVNMLHHRSLRHRCTECGGPLRAECQVLPTALYYLRPEQYLPPRRQPSNTTENQATKTEDQSVDFGTVTVYTCANWCQAKKPGVVLTEAFLLVEPAPAAQDVSEESRREAATQKKTKKTDLRDFMTSSKPLEKEWVE